MESERRISRLGFNYSLRLPKRYYVALMLSSGLALSMIYRLILSLAIIEMVDDDSEEFKRAKDCIDSDLTSHLLVDNRKGPKYNWGCRLPGFVKASFFPGYILSHVPGGYASDAFGGLLLYGQSVFISGVLTLLSPLCVYTSPYLFMLNRFFQGLSQGPQFAALNSLLAQWSPPQERTRLSVLSNTGVVVGEVVGNALVGLCLSWLPWADSFYIFGAFSIPWTILWLKSVSDSPKNDPAIDPDEREFIMTSIGNEANIMRRKPVPWRQMFLSVPFWVLVLVNFGQDWGFYTIIIDLPKFMHDILHFNISENGLANALPWLLMFFVTISAAIISDWALSENYVSKTFLRKSFAAVASVGSASMIVAATHTVGSRWLTSFLFVLAVGLFGFVYVGVRVTTLDIAPNFAGLVFAFVNGIGAFAGVLSPLLIGLLTQDGHIEEWQLCFLIVSYIMVVTLIPFLLFGSAEVQPWNGIGSRGTPVSTCESAARDEDSCI